MPYFSPDEAGGGFISLEDIDEVDDKTAEANKQADLEKAKAEQDAKEKEEADKKAAEDKAAEEAKNKEIETKTTETEEISGEEDGSFWDDVDKLRGEVLDVDFGDTDPSTPEGALIYEKAVRADELAKFEQHLADSNPRAYAFLTHILDGGKEEDFFKIAGEPGTLPTEAELQNSVEIQKEIITQDYKAKGLSDKAIAATIKALISDDELEETAAEALKNRIKVREDGVKAAQAQTELEAKQKTEKIKEMNDWVSSVISTGKVDNIIIPEKDRAPFAKAFASSIRIENGQFVSVTPVTQETVNDVFKEKFFSYKKGNIADLIEKAAATANTKRLVRSIPNSNKKPLGAGQKSENSLISLGDMED
ncbi:unnamed protein product [Sphagnum balticum]